MSELTSNSCTKNVEIITLNQHLTETAADEAWAKTHHPDDIDNVIDKLRKIKHTHSSEFVDVKEDKIVVGVKDTKINDETITYAFKLISKVKDLNEHKRTEFEEYKNTNEMDNQE